MNYPQYPLIHVSGAVVFISGVPILRIFTKSDNYYISLQQPMKAPTAVATVVTGQSVYHDVSTNFIITRAIQRQPACQPVILSLVSINIF